MKHLLRGLWIVALILCCNFQQVFAQQMPPIPVDKNVRIGKLDNGLTYYIRKNSQSVVDKIQHLIDEGVYPNKLF
jgi:zinc protease